MSLFEALNIGTRGLAASQTALDVMGQNVTNANTDGYTRKRLNLSAASRPDGKFGQIGFGVDMLNVQALRDNLLDKQIQAVKTDVGGAEVTDSLMTKIQDIFAEPKDSALSSTMDKFWNAWQDLANNPSNLTARQAVLDSATTLTDRFNSMGKDLNSLRIDKNDEIATQVGNVNKLLDEIGKLNTTIATAEMGDSGQNANDSRDARELKLKDLSKLIDVAYTEDAQGRYIVTSGGNLILSAEGALPLKVDRTTIPLPDGTQYAQTSISLTSTNQSFEPKSGALAALVKGRDEIVPGYQDKLDKLAKSLVTAVNSAHEQGYDLQGKTGLDFFDTRVTGASDIRLSASLADNPSAVAAGQGGTSTAPGAPLLLAIPAGGTNLDLKATNPVYRNLVEGSTIVKTVGPPSVNLAEGADKDYVVDSQNGQIIFNNYAQYPAGTAVTVSFRYNTAGPNGKGDGANALRIAQLRQAAIADPDVDGNFTATLGDSWATTVGGLGAESKRATDALTALKELDKTLGDQSQSLSGVSIDEELADMVKFQHSYQASARFMTTVSDMMQTLINL